MNTKNTDVVAEYLHEVDVRLAGLPVLQRRELLADLTAHIATERAERNVQAEGELIEILERLGSPEVVASAAHDEFGPSSSPKKRIRWYWPAAAVAAVVLVLFVCAGAFVTRSAGEAPAPAQIQAPATAVPRPR